MAVSDARIPEAIRCFNDIYLEGIPTIIRDKSAFLAFVCVLTGIESLSGYRYDQGNLEQRFTKFIEEYFPDEYKAYLEDLWRFRKGMIHAFSPKNFVLTHNHPKVHFRKASDGRLILNAEDFFEALRSAAKKFFDEVAANPARQKTMVQRLDNVNMGGSIGVFPVVAQP